MTAYWDEKSGEVRALGGLSMSDDAFIERLVAIEEQVYRDVSLCVGDREVPSMWRERLLNLMARYTVRRPIPSVPGGGDLEARVLRDSPMITWLHAAFHALARERIETRFGLLTDDPRDNVTRRDDYDAEGETHHG
jgi:hypothetical protein